MATDLLETLIAVANVAPLVGLACRSLRLRKLTRLLAANAFERLLARRADRTEWMVAVDDDLLATLEARS